MPGPLILFLAAALALLNGCKTSADVEARPPAAESRRSDPPASDNGASLGSRWSEILSYPETTLRITAYTNAKRFGPILLWAQSLTEEPCAEDVISKVHAYSSVDFTVASDRHSVHVFYGDIDRDAVERCLSSVASANNGSLEAAGPLTKATLEGRSFSIRWLQNDTPRTAIVGSPEAASAFVTGKRLAREDGRIAALVSRVDRARDSWSVSRMSALAREYTLELDLDSSVATPSVEGRVTLLFDTPQLAQDAERTLLDRLASLDEANTISVRKLESEVTLELQAKGPQVSVLLNALAELIQ